MAGPHCQKNVQKVGLSLGPVRLIHSLWISYPQPVDNFCLWISYPQSVENLWISF